MKYLFLLVVLSAAGIHRAAAQTAHDGHVFLRYEDLADAHLDLSGVAWRYHPSDSLVDRTATDPRLDDSDWPLIWPELRSDSSTTALFDGSGWFRLDVTLDSTLARTGFGLSVFQAGNVELYWNGRKLIEAGRRGSSPRGGAARATTGIPTYVTAPDSAHGVLTVWFDTARWSEQFRSTLDDRDRFSPGFAVVVGRIPAMANTYARRWIKVNEFTFAMGVMLALSLLHLLMYRPNSGEIAHLYFGISVLFMLPPIFLFGITLVPSSGSFYVSGEVTTIVWRYAYLVAQILWLASIHSLLRDRLGRRYWVVIAVLVAFPLMLELGAPFMTVQRTIFAIAMVGTLDAIAVTISAIRRKQTDALVLALGFIGALVGTQLFQAQMNADFAVFRTRVLGETFFLSSKSIPIWLYFLSTPIAMTVLLSKRYVESRANLKTTVARRTAELRQALSDVRKTQARLIQQEKMASLGSLTSGIAHEVKNPLNFVNNFAEITAELTRELREALASGDREEVDLIVEDIARNTEVIARNGKRADSIIVSMMQHASEASSEPESVDVNGFVEEYVNLVAHGMSARSTIVQIEIHRDYSDRAGSVFIRPQELGRVLVNLLENAFDAVGNMDAPEIRVATRRSEDTVSILVSDNGPGVPEDIRPKIFEPFYTTKPTGEGTGLGLSLSFDIVSGGHGGDLRLDESDGDGATFIIDLPTDGGYHP
jgi:signal transduction histidine kinase